MQIVTSQIVLKGIKTLCMEIKEINKKLVKLSPALSVWIKFG